MIAIGNHKYIFMGRERGGGRAGGVEREGRTGGECLTNGEKVMGRGERC